METIWYVYKKWGGGAPHYRHLTYESAVTEAKRLIDTVGGEYEILELKAVVRPAPSHVIETTVPPKMYSKSDYDMVPF